MDQPKKKAPFYMQPLGLNEEIVEAGGYELLAAYHLVLDQIKALEIHTMPSEARIKKWTGMHHHKVKRLYPLITRFLLVVYPGLTQELPGSYSEVTQELPKGYPQVTPPSKQGSNPHGSNTREEESRVEESRVYPPPTPPEGSEVHAENFGAEQGEVVSPPAPVPAERAPMFPQAVSLVQYPPETLALADLVIAEIQQVQPVYCRPREDWASAIVRVLSAYPNAEEFWAVLRYHLRADRFGWRFLMNPSRLMTPQKDNWVYLLADWQKAQKTQGAGKAHNVVALPTTNQPKAPSFDEFLQERFAPRRVQRWPKGVYKATCLETWEVEDVSDQVKALRQEFDAQQQPQEVQA